ncbi:MAG: branched chain amino acid aminotransferase [Cytophagia bacterium]|nr:branched chain amino acid aminotransferase [Cytophagia bacterium]
METAINNIRVQRTTQSRLKEIDFSNLAFGQHISDHMIVAEYADGKWGEAAVLPYGEMAMSPAILSLHYGQAIFEGMKAYKTSSGAITIFRLKRHHERMNRSLDRMCMPPIPYDLFEQSLTSLIDVDRDWIPTSEGASLYIRPVVFASEARLGVKVSDQYKFVIMTSPVGPYYSKPLRIKVEETYVRAAEGGAGFAKCAGNYGVSFYPTQMARKDVEELIETHKQGTLTEAFGAGTAAIVAPIATINIHGTDYTLPPASEGSIQARVKKKLTNMRMGLEKDNHGWNFTLR